MKIFCALFLLPLTSLYLFLFVLFPSYAWALNGSDVQERMSADVQAGKPLVAHLIVALADNKHQGIVPTTKTLGDGQNPKTNLYWGAMYGVDSFIPGKGRWKRLKLADTPQAPILKKSVFYRRIMRGGKWVDAYIVAEAWDGRFIHQATNRFLGLSAGAHTETISLRKQEKIIKIEAGGKAHLTSYIGHNSFLDVFPLNKWFRKRIGQETNSLPRSAVVLACQSKAFFSNLLKTSDAHPLILTKGNMAPEAYTIEAIIRAWFQGKSLKQTHLAAAQAYKKYQNISLRASKLLFSYK